MLGLFKTNATCEKDIVNTISLLDINIEMLKKSIAKGVPYDEVCGVKWLLEFYRTSLYEKLREYNDYDCVINHPSLAMENGEIVVRDT